MYKSQDEKNVAAARFINKNQHATSSKNKINTHNVLWTKSVLKREKSRCENPPKSYEQNEFHKDKIQGATSFTNKYQCTTASTNKISTKQVPWTKLVSREEKSMYQSHEEKNQYLTSYKNKKEDAPSSVNKN